MGNSTTVFYLPGMDCPVEEKLVRASLRNIKGIANLDFNLLQRKLRITHEAASLPEITRALAGLDMGSTLLEEGHSAGQSEPVAADIPWKKLIWALVLAAVSEGIELYAEWGAKEPRIWEILSFVCAAAAVIICGLSTYKKGWIAIRRLNLNINALMAVAVTGAALIGQWPEAAMVMALFNLSEAIESRALLKARDSISELVSLAPHMAETQNAAGEWVEVHAHDVEPGQRCRVRPGAKIPLDGRVLAGASAVNQASITGESMPVEKKAGDFLYAGTLNGNGELEFEVTAGSHDTTLARIIHAVEEAQATRAPMQRFVDVFASWYTPAVFVIAILCAVVPPLLGAQTWLAAIYTGLVMLVIGCPCALVISTPVSIVSGMAAATKSGILIKGGVFLERGRLLRCIAFDKTGTITTGNPVLQSVTPVGSISDAQALTLAASLSARSDHPVSEAITKAAAERKLALMPVSDFSAEAGKGIRGIIGGEKYGLGNRGMFPDHAPQAVETEIAGLEAKGQTVTVLTGPSGIIALFAVADAIRPGSKKVMSELKALGVTPVMLTGDNELAAKAIGEEAGISDVEARLLPVEKLNAIRKLKSRFGMTGMVGDGINDAPALAEANISFAMAKAGTDTAIETADVALMDDDLGKIPRFIRLSRSTFAILVENIAIALLIKAVFFGLALANMATMWMAVFADVGAALIVIANGLRALHK